VSPGSGSTDARRVRRPSRDHVDAGRPPGLVFEAWHGTADWHRTMVTAQDVSRISAEFLEEERQTLPTSGFASEYLCEFTDSDGAVFDAETVRAALSDEVKPLWR